MSGTPSSPDLDAILTDRYRIERQIGAGGMATVYLAHDLKLGREVALKVLRPELGAVLGTERFLAEVKITARLDHPHILTLIDSGSAGGLLYYVLPYVRGESLRDLLNREQQLGVDQALAITKQVGSALDYAHRQGVIHRDIKPENILLHEGVAVLADFGIALAVQEAAGSRITETGLSLGTPQYMSPEQATGDRAIDARSDVYSLAAVLYEMIAGEPPITGATKQAIFAKLLTEPPTKLRVIRNTVPEVVERAVGKALSKVPADRFATAGAFARALGVPAGPTSVMPARRWSARPMVAALGLAAGVAVVALIGLSVREKWGVAKGVGVTLTDRRQITFTGHVSLPAISSNGKTLAYRTSNCGPAGCTYGVELQDVGGAASRRLFDGASAIYSIEWSPDSRNLLFSATTNPLFGMFVVSALGDTPRLVSYGASFFAGGDSLLLRRTPVDTEDKWLLVSGLDGRARDSIHVAGPGEKLTFFTGVPGSRWIVVGIYPRFVSHSNKMAFESRVIERDGRVVSRTLVGDAGNYPQGHASSDALWVAPGGLSWPRRDVLRIPLDSATGRLSSSIDTLSIGVFTSFGVTADGRHLVFDEGSTEFDLWGLDVREAVRGVFPEQKHLLHSTSAIDVRLSPNGNRLVVGHDLGRSAAGLQRWFTRPFGDGAETPLALAGLTAETIWSDDSTVAIRDRVPAGARLALMDVRTGVVRDALVVPDPVPNAYAHLPTGGWVWVRAWKPEMSVQLPADTFPRRIPLPAWYSAAFYADLSRDGRFVAFSGSNAPNADSMRVSVLSLADSAVTPWFTSFDALGQVSWLKDGSLLVLVGETPETYSIYRLLGPGRAEKLGAIPRRVSSVSVSRDLKRAAVVVHDYRGDAWMSRVVRR